MAVSKKLRKTIQHKTLIVALVVTTLCAVALYWSVYTHTSQEPHPSVSRQSEKPPVLTKKPLMAGGVVVPVQWQSKARSLGYYCPSWSAKPGEIEPDVCIPINK
ncbi:MAG TPA: hypothetical protein VGS28_01540 [Candidatus Saccharimonadales bacterium]|nr:hypothetical protein [Candidatus Saccharimonadales bacterium]